MATFLNLYLACFGFQQPLNYAPASAYSSYGYYPGNNGGSNGMPYIAASAAKSRMASNSHIFADKNLDTDNFIDYNSDKLSTCKRRFADHRLQCAYPFDRRVPITETECEQLCVKNLLSLCQSYQFDSIGKVCELYDIVPSYNEEDDTELTSFRKADDPLPGINYLLPFETYLKTFLLTSNYSSR